MAQHWTAPGSNEYPDETPVYVQVNINGVEATGGNGLELAAFIDDETSPRACTSTTEPVGMGTDTAVPHQWFVLRVKGNKGDTTNPNSSDMGKTIKFRAFYDGIEYDFIKTIGFTGETYVPTPLVLNLDAVTGVSLPETIEINQPVSAFPYKQNLTEKSSLLYGATSGNPTAPSTDTSYTLMNESGIRSEITYSWSSPDNGITFSGDNVTINNGMAMSYNAHLTVTIGQQQFNANTTIAVTIATIPVQNITCDLTEIDKFYAYDDFAAYIAGHIKVLPEDASNKNYTLEVVGAEAGLTDGCFTTSGHYTVNIKPEDTSYPGTPATVTVNVYMRPTNIGTDQATIEVKMGQNVFSAIKDHQTLSWPIGYEPNDYAKSDVMYTMNPDPQECIGTDGTAIKIGSVEVMVMLTDGLTPSPTFKGNDQYTVTVNIVTALKVTAIPSDVTTFVKNGTTVSDNTPAIVTVQNPAGEVFNKEGLKITFDDRYTGFPYAMQCNIVELGGGQTAEETTTYGFRIQPLFVGNAHYTVSNNDTPLCEGNITIQKEETLSEGWTWVSVVTGGIDLGSSAAPSVLTQADIVEIRSQEQLLWNDPTYGYVGSIKGLNANDGMYKVKTNKPTKVNWGSSSAVENVGSKTLYTKYTWVNNPYEFDITLDRISQFLAGVAPVEGDRIIIQGGFAEYANEKWNAGEGFALKEGSGFMYYNNSADEKLLSFAPGLLPDASILQQQTTAGARTFGGQTAFADLFQYDVHAFADNMSMVAVIENLDFPEDYTLGVFAGDECRGRGRVAVDGKMFVSAVGKSGETMTFKLVNNHTGDILPIEGSVAFGQLLGSLRAPVTLNVADPTAIGKVGAAQQSTEVYDLSGRRIAASQRGISIERKADGTVRKVVKK